MCFLSLGTIFDGLALRVGCCRPGSTLIPRVFQCFCASPIGVGIRIVNFDHGLHKFLLCCPFCWPLSERLWRRPPPASQTYLCPLLLHCCNWSNALLIIASGTSRSQRLLHVWFGQHIDRELGVPTLQLAQHFGNMFDPCTLHVDNCHPRKRDNSLFLNDFANYPFFDNALQYVMYVVICGFGGRQRQLRQHVFAHLGFFIVVGLLHVQTS